MIITDQELRKDLTKHLVSLSFEEKFISFNEDFLLYKGIPVVQLNKIFVKTVIDNTILGPREWEINNFNEEFQRALKWIEAFKSWYYQFKYYWLRHPIKYFFKRLFKTEVRLFEDFIIPTEEEVSEREVTSEMIRENLSLFKKRYFKEENEENQESLETRLMNLKYNPNPHRDLGVQIP